MKEGKLIETSVREQDILPEPAGRIFRKCYPALQDGAGPSISDDPIQSDHSKDVAHEELMHLRWAHQCVSLLRFKD